MLLIAKEYRQLQKQLPKEKQMGKYPSKEGRIFGVRPDGSRARIGGITHVYTTPRRRSEAEELDALIQDNIREARALLRQNPEFAWTDITADMALCVGRQSLAVEDAEKAAWERHRREMIEDHFWELWGEEEEHELIR